MQRTTDNNNPAVAAKQPGSDEWSMTALATVTKLSNIIGFLPINLDDILKAVVHETFALFAPHACCIYLTGPDGELEPAACKTRDGSVPDVHYQSRAEACAALRDGLPHIGCVASECRNRKPSCDDAPYVCIPLTTGGDVNGVLSITLHAGENLSRDRLNVLLSIANQVSATIQRHRLFEKLKAEKQEIERAYRSISDLNELLTGKMEELKTTQDRLIQSEKLAATGELSAGLCHEINNPISIILNRIECLKLEADDTALPEAVFRDLDVIYNHAMKVSTLVKDLLIFSRHHPTEFRPVDLRTVLDKAVASLHEALGQSGCAVQLSLPDGLPRMVGDDERLEQVFRNLLSNAVDAMPGGGNITIEAEMDRGTGRMVIRVRDEGEGMPKENLRRIFDPFFTTKKLGRGTGLGLPICYGIVKSHGGDIRAASEVGRGTTFILWLPAEEA